MERERKPVRKETGKWWRRYCSAVYPRQQKHRGERNEENENSVGMEVKKETNSEKAEK